MVDNNDDDDNDNDNDNDDDDDDDEDNDDDDVDDNDDNDNDEIGMIIKHLFCFVFFLIIIHLYIANSAKHSKALSIKGSSQTKTKIYKKHKMCVTFYPLGGAGTLVILHNLHFIQRAL